VSWWLPAVNFLMYVCSLGIVGKFYGTGIWLQLDKQEK